MGEIIIRMLSRFATSALVPPLSVNPDPVRPIDPPAARCQGFWIDIQILWLTYLVAVRRDGVSH